MLTNSCPVCCRPNCDVDWCLIRIVILTAKSIQQPPPQKKKKKRKKNKKNFFFGPKTSKPLQHMYCSTPTIGVLRNTHRQQLSNSDLGLGMEHTKMEIFLVPNQLTMNSLKTLFSPSKKSPSKEPLKVRPVSRLFRSEGFRRTRSRRRKRWSASSRRTGRTCTRSFTSRRRGKQRYSVVPV